jgi:hypothetical protein
MSLYKVKSSGLLHAYRCLGLYEEASGISLCVCWRGHLRVDSPGDYPPAACAQL